MGERHDFRYPSQFIVDLLRITALAISKTFWFIKYHGRENIPPRSSGAFLIAANHQTYVDPVWVCLPMRRRMRYMAVDKAFAWPVVGSVMRYLGAFPVRMDSAGVRRAMVDSIRCLRDGAALTVFPEGGREFADGKPLEFRPGAVRIAAAAGVPILPVTISGGNRIWPHKQKYPRLFRRVTIKYHPLMDVDGDRPEEMTERLREIICGSTCVRELAAESAD